MNLEAKISFFFRRTSSVICPVFTEGTTVTCAPKLADRKGEAVNNKITASWYEKGMRQFLPKQFRYLQKCPPGSVKPGTGAKPGKKMLVITFHKRIPGIFRIYANQLATDTQSNNFRVGHFCSIHISPLWNRIRDKLSVQVIQRVKLSLCYFHYKQSPINQCLQRLWKIGNLIFVVLLWKRQSPSKLLMHCSLAQHLM